MNTNTKQKLLLLSDAQEETVWATPVGGNRFSVASIPFMAYNISFGDIVETISHESGLPTASQIVKKAGHRTIRLIVEDSSDFDDEKTKKIVESFKKFGCGIEGFEPVLIALDIPPEVDIHMIVDFCKEQKFEWEFGDPQPDKAKYTIIK
jgi:hypothetical protein